MSILNKIFGRRKWDRMADGVGDDLDLDSGYDGAVWAPAAEPSETVVDTVAPDDLSVPEELRGCAVVEVRYPDGTAKVFYRAPDGFQVDEKNADVLISAHRLEMDRVPAKPIRPSAWVSGAGYAAPPPVPRAAGRLDPAALRQHAPPPVPPAAVPVPPPVPPARRSPPPMPAPAAPPAARRVAPAAPPAARRAAPAGPAGGVAPVARPAVAPPLEPAGEAAAARSVAPAEPDERPLEAEGAAGGVLDVLDQLPSDDSLPPDLRGAILVARDTGFFYLAGDGHFVPKEKAEERIEAWERSQGQAAAAADGPAGIETAGTQQASELPAPSVPARPAEPQPVPAGQEEAQPVPLQPAETQPVSAQPAESQPVRPASPAPVPVRPASPPSVPATGKGVGAGPSALLSGEGVLDVIEQLPADQSLPRDLRGAILVARQDGFYYLTSSGEFLAKEKAEELMEEYERAHRPARPAGAQVASPPPAGPLPQTALGAAEAPSTALPPSQELPSPAASSAAPLPDRRAARPPGRPPPRRPAPDRREKEKAAREALIRAALSKPGGEPAAATRVETAKVRPERAPAPAAAARAASGPASPAKAAPRRPSYERTEPVRGSWAEPSPQKMRWLEHIVTIPEERPAGASENWGYAAPVKGSDPWEKALKSAGLQAEAGDEEPTREVDLAAMGAQAGRSAPAEPEAHMPPSPEPAAEELSPALMPLWEAVEALRKEIVAGTWVVPTEQITQEAVFKICQDEVMRRQEDDRVERTVSRSVALHDWLLKRWEHHTGDLARELKQDLETGTQVVMVINPARTRDMDLLDLVTLVRLRSVQGKRVAVGRELSRQVTSVSISDLTHYLMARGVADDLRFRAAREPGLVGDSGLRKDQIGRMFMDLLAQRVNISLQDVVRQVEQRHAIRLTRIIPLVLTAVEPVLTAVTERLLYHLDQPR